MKDGKMFNNYDLNDEMYLWRCTTGPPHFVQNDETIILSFSNPAITF